MSIGSLGASDVSERARCSGVRGVLCEPGTTKRQESSYSALPHRLASQLRMLETKTATHVFHCIYTQCYVCNDKRRSGELTP